MNYYNQPEVIDVTVTKAGYVTLVTSFDLYVDPPAVTKGAIWEYTMIPIGVVALIAAVTSFIIVRSKKKN